jgi:hypothetical protein
MTETTTTNIDPRDVERIHNIHHKPERIKNETKKKLRLFLKNSFNLKKDFYYNNNKVERQIKNIEQKDNNFYV